MLELGVVELNQVQPFIKQFRLLDFDGNARLGAWIMPRTAHRAMASRTG